MQQARRGRAGGPKAALDTDPLSSRWGENPIRVTTHKRHHRQLP